MPSGSELVLGIGSLFQNQEEHQSPEHAIITGKIPNWLNGSYLRVGPGKFDIGETSMHHFIDGYAMLSKFDISNGLIKFNKKYVQSEAYQKASEQKQPYFPEFATKGNIASVKTFFSRVRSTFGSSDITDNCSINLYQIGSELYAASETCHVHSIDTEKLESLDKIDYYKVFGVHMATAHPIEDKNGDWWNIGTSFTTGCKYQVLKIPSVRSLTVKEAIKKASVVASIYPSWTASFSYYHAFAMTANYIIMIEQPLTMSVLKMTDAKLKGKSIREIMEWTPTEKTRFHVVSKKNGEVLKTKYYSESPFFFFHLVNSYEDEDHIVIDIDAYPSHAIMDKMSIERLRSGDLDQKDPSRIQRYVLPIIKNTNDVSKGMNLVKLNYTSATAKRDGELIILTSQGFGEVGFEGPQINPMKKFEKHRYVYGTGSMLPGYYANALCKIDLLTGDCKLWRDNEFVYPGEPLFVPSPESIDEDSGVIITTCSDVRPNGKDFIVFLDAQNMTELGRANVHSQIPQSLHGIFLPKKSSTGNSSKNGN